MCELCLPRRAVLAGAGGLVVAAALGVPAAAAQVPGPPPIVPRAEWGPDLLPVGPVPDEPDVRFLLVHHTVNANDYADGGTVELLRAIYRFHTSPEKGWPDIAYNFFVDRFGTVYEGRTGSIEGAKAGDATGGSQGFAQLCAFVGDHQVQPPSDAALGSMAALLGFLGDRHGLDLAPGATATFVSRGSNRRPAGEQVTTPTISGHRDMSSTACPGEAAYALVTDGTFARLATAARTQATTTTVALQPTTTTSASPPASTSSTPPSTATATTLAPAVTEEANGGDSSLAPAAVGIAAAAAAAGALVALRRRTGG
jgi:hypothetical protein